MNISYVYAHVRHDTNTIFYVGKGYGTRFKHRGKRNQYWARITEKTEWTPIIIESGLTEDEAYNREAYWIRYYKEIGQCEANFQLGGRGSSQGLKHKCVDCQTKLRNIYAKRCQQCRTLYKKTDEYKKIHSEGQKRRFQDPDQRKFVASLRLGKPPPNKKSK